MCSHCDDVISDLQLKAVAVDESLSVVGGSECVVDFETDLPQYG